MVNNQEEKNQASETVVIAPSEKKRLFKGFRRGAKKEKKERVRPKSVIFQGAAVASIVITLIYFGFYGATFSAGIGVFWELLIGILAGAVGITILGLLHALFIFIGRKLPRMFKGDYMAGFGTVFKAMPIPSTSAIWGSIMSLLLFQLLWFQYPLPFAFLTGTLIIILEALLGAAIAFTVTGGFKKIGIVKRILVILLVLLVMAFNVYLVLWLSSSGSAEHIIDYRTFVPKHLQKFQAADPSLPGPYKVGSLTYGSGSDKRRPEYGEDAAIKTETVDASVIFKGYKGYKAKVRSWYWGFDIKAFPVNGRVWYPEDTGPFPLVLIVHGNHDMNDYSDPGYEYLGELLASQGFITVSVDENFLNGGFIGGIPGKKSENATRGWMMLQHLKAWQKFNRDEQNPFFLKVDLDNIALIGHSRGGEAVAHAAAQDKLRRFPDDANLELDFNFAIKTVIAIAPADGQYKPSGKLLPLENVNYFIIQGGHDADVSIFFGNRQYQRVTFSDDNYWCKASLYVYEANHGQFNTTWGRTDFYAPMSWLLNLKPLLLQEDQIKIAKFFIAAFLQATIKEKREYLHLFRNHRLAAGLLPETIYVNRFEDSTFLEVTGFEEDIDPLTTSLKGGTLKGENLAVWSEDRLYFRQGMSQENHVVRLGWDNEEKKKEKEKQDAAKYIIELPGQFAGSNGIGAETLLVFSICDSGEEPPEPEEEKEEQTGAEETGAKEKEKGKKDGEDKDKKKDEEEKEKPPLDLTLQLIDSAGKEASLPLSYFSTLHPPLKETFTKWPMMESFIYQKQSEPILETFEFPLKAFAAVNPEFDPTKLMHIIFKFDISAKGVVYVDEIGFRGL